MQVTRFVKKFAEPMGGGGGIFNQFARVFIGDKVKQRPLSMHQTLQRETPLTWFALNDPH